MTSWKEVEKLAKAKNVLAAEMQELSEQLARKARELLEVNLAQFKAIPKADALFYDSPINPTKIMHDFKRQLMKVSSPWELRHDNPAEIASFTDEVKHGNRWALKMKSQKEDIF